ncbi:hypothetical protein D3C72_1950830 [compost metagenome]
MGATAAKVASQRFANLAFAWISVGSEQACSAHYHAVNAVAALDGLFLDEGTLQWVRALGSAQALKRHNVRASKCGHRKQAGPRRCPIQQHCARAALAKSASKLWAMEA